jgi:uncharacterized protein YndB with AHSA1/START domain
MAKRTDTASRFIHAAPETIYHAHLDAAAMAAWRPPEGMTGRFDAFEPRPGGRFRMVLTYADAAAALGKTSAAEDVVGGRFAELVPNERIVELVRFESDDPAFAGEMRITTTLRPVSGGTEVTIRCDDVPSGISAKDHEVGLASTLANLATFTEAPARAAQAEPPADEGGPR